MHYDPILLQIVGALLVILATALLSRVLNQPHVVGYILAGVVLGPHGLEFFQEYELVSRIGEIGVVLLLFFVGMETTPRQLAQGWRVTVLGTLVQIAASVGLMVAIGMWLDWPLARSILMGFVISLSSTAVVLNYLRDTHRAQTKLGRDTLGVLLAQDLYLIPMLLITAILAGRGAQTETLILQGIGGVLAIALMAWMTLGRVVRLPLARFLRRDRELQVFLAFGLCLGFALMFGMLHLSSALGAFLAGMLVGVARETNWVHHRLEPFRVMFVAVFFVSIGLLLDVKFVLANAWLVGGVTLAVFVGNTAINTLIFRLLGEGWNYSIFAGAHLAQIGEFSFVLAAAGAAQDLLPDFTYKLVISVIALSLVLSPAWIALIARLQRKPASL
ncbi:MAG TPA: cation:proton antiporter [Verrucomicrobiae bacterium]|nr:cation:proton antiporter [Verrucomicrobiae bacterium]